MELFESSSRCHFSRWRLHQSVDSDDFVRRFSGWNSIFSSFLCSIFRECKYEQDLEFSATSRQLNYRRAKEERQKKIKRLKQLQKIQQGQKRRTMKRVNAWHIRKTWGHKGLYKRALNSPSVQPNQNFRPKWTQPVEPWIQN